MMGSLPGAAVKPIGAKPVNLTERHAQAAFSSLHGQRQQSFGRSFAPFAPLDASQGPMASKGGAAMGRQGDTEFRKLSTQSETFTTKTQQQPEPRPVLPQQKQNSIHRHKYRPEDEEDRNSGRIQTSSVQFGKFPDAMQQSQERGSGLNNRETNEKQRLSHKQSNQQYKAQSGDQCSLKTAANEAKNIPTVQDQGRIYFFSNTGKIERTHEAAQAHEESPTNIVQGFHETRLAENILDEMRWQTNSAAMETPVHDANVQSLANSGETGFSQAISQHVQAILKSERQASHLIVALQARCQELLQRLEQTDAQLYADAQAKESSIQTLKDHLSHLQGQIVCIGEMINECFNVREGLRDFAQSVETDCKNNALRLTEYQKILQDPQTGYAALQDAITSQRKDLREIRSSMSTQLEKARATAATSEEKCRFLNVRLEELSEKATRSEATEKQATAELSQLNKSFQEVQSALREAKTQIALGSENSKALEIDLANLRNELAMQVKDQAMAAKQHHSDTSHMAERLADKDKELERRGQQLAEAELKLKSYLESDTVLKIELAKAQRAQADADNKVECRNKTIEELREKLSERQRVLEEERLQYRKEKDDRVRMYEGDLKRLQLTIDEQTKELAALRQDVLDDIGERAVADHGLPQLTQQVKELSVGNAKLMDLLSRFDATKADEPVNETVAPAVPAKKTVTRRNANKNKHKDDKNGNESDEERSGKRLRTDIVSATPTELTIDDDFPGLDGAAESGEQSTGKTRRGHGDKTRAGSAASKKGRDQIETLTEEGEWAESI